MSSFDSVTDACARIGEHPDRRYPLRETCQKLGAMGYPTSVSAVHKANMHGKGPPRVIYGNKSIIRLGDAIEWAMGRTLGLQDWTQKQKAGKPRAELLHAGAAGCEAVAA